MDSRPLHRKRSNPELRATLKAFNRGDGFSHKKVSDKKVKGKVKLSERLVGEATVKAAKTNYWLLPEQSGVLEAEGMEQTWNFEQRDIVAAVEVGAAAKAMNLALKDLGPYTIDFSSSGRHLLLGGQKGHLSMLDWQKHTIVCEEQASDPPPPSPLLRGRHQKREFCSTLLPPSRQGALCVCLQIPPRPPSPSGA